MERSPDFAPRWASPPGKTIRDALVERGLSLEVFAESIGVPDPRLQGLLSGSETISIELARRISTSIGGSVEFWMARDGQYRDDLARVEADRWAQSLPISKKSCVSTRSLSISIRHGPAQIHSLLRTPWLMAVSLSAKRSLVVP
jgi:plasmid maintenance system antidote protein VapI